MPFPVLPIVMQLGGMLASHYGNKLQQKNQQEQSMVQGFDEGPGQFTQEWQANRQPPRQDRFVGPQY